MHNISGWDWEIGKKLIADISTWKGMFENIEEPYVSPDGEKIAAIVAPKFGRWTIAVDGAPWSLTFGDLVTEAVFSPDSEKILIKGIEGDADGGKYYRQVLPLTDITVPAKGEKNA